MRATKQLLLMRITLEEPDLNVEDLLRLFEGAAGGDPDAAESLRLMVAGPAAARKVIAANPALAELEGLVDLIDDGKGGTQATRLH